MVQEIKAREERLNIYILTIIGDIAGMNQYRLPHPMQFTVYRTFIATSGGAMTSAAHHTLGYGMCPYRDFPLLYTLQAIRALFSLIALMASIFLI